MRISDINLNGLSSHLIKTFTDDDLFGDTNSDMIKFSQPYPQFLTDFNNRHIYPNNFNQIFQFLEYLMVDQMDIQTFLLKYMTPSEELYQIDDQFQNHFKLISVEDIVQNNQPLRKLLLEEQKYYPQCTKDEKRKEHLNPLDMVRPNKVTKRLHKLLKDNTRETISEISHQVLNNPKLQISEDELEQLLDNSDIIIDKGIPIKNYKLLEKYYQSFDLYHYPDKIDVSKCLTIKQILEENQQIILPSFFFNKEERLYGTYVSGLLDLDNWLQFFDNLNPENPDNDTWFNKNRLRLLYYIIHSGSQKCLTYLFESKNDNLVQPVVNMNLLSLKTIRNLVSISILKSNLTIFKFLIDLIRGSRDYREFFSSGFGKGLLLLSLSGSGNKVTFDFFEFIYNLALNSPDKDNLEEFHQEHYYSYLESDFRIFDLISRDYSINYTRLCRWAARRDNFKLFQYCLQKIDSCIINRDLFDHCNGINLEIFNYIVTQNQQIQVIAQQGFTNFLEEHNFDHNIELYIYAFQMRMIESPLDIESMWWYPNIKRFMEFIVCHYWNNLDNYRNQNQLMSTPGTSILYPTKITPGEWPIVVYCDICNNCLEPGKLFLKPLTNMFAICGNCYTKANKRYPDIFKGNLDLELQNI